MQCHIGQCVTGIATQDPEHEKRYDPEAESHNIHAHIWDEDYEGAFEAITSTNPFSSICGRVCDAPCEPACRRVDSVGAVQIRKLKRFVMDKLGATWRPPAAPVTRTPLRPRCPPHPAPARRCCPTAPGQ